MRKSVIAFAALFAASTIAAPASAEEASIAVSYADLNLSAPAGVATLKHRIEAAAEKVCQKPYSRDLKTVAAWQECVTVARTEALERLAAREASNGRVLAALF